MYGRLENPRSATSIEFIQGVRELLIRSERVELGRVYARGRSATVDVYYLLQGGQNVIAIRYVVTKSDNVWKIDGTKTLELRRRMRDFS